MQNNVNSRDLEYMKRALKLAARGLGRVSPNPAVGAVVVKNSEIVGEGYHLWKNVRHAEIIALERAGSKSAGADLFVTLEPCAHYGRTPPCVDAILSSGIRRVVAAVEDPDPRVSGEGISRLRKGGVRVDVGVCRQEAAELNEPFFYSVKRGRPLVTLKLAMSMDARIATATGESKWITGVEAREYVQRLRFLHDAVLVGSGTLKADNPRLDVRGRKKKSITRVLLDSSGSSLSPGMRLLESKDPVLVFHDILSSPSRIAVGDFNPEYCGVSGKDGMLSWPEILEELGRRGIRSLLVEGGGKVAASLIEQRRVNRLFLFYSPMFIGSEGVPGVGGLQTSLLSESFRFRVVRCARLGRDLLVEGRSNPDEPAEANG